MLYYLQFAINNRQGEDLRIKNMHSQNSAGKKTICQFIFMQFDIHEGKYQISGLKDSFSCCMSRLYFLARSTLVRPGWKGYDHKMEFQEKPYVFTPHSRYRTSSLLKSLLCLLAGECSVLVLRSSSRLWFPIFLPPLLSPGRWDPLRGMKVGPILLLKVIIFLLAPLRSGVRVIPLCLFQWCCATVLFFASLRMGVRQTWFQFAQLLCDSAAETLSGSGSVCPTESSWGSLLNRRLQWRVLNRSVASWRTLCISQLCWQELWRDAKLRLVTSSKGSTQPEGEQEQRGKGIHLQKKPTVGTVIL